MKEQSGLVKSAIFIACTLVVRYIRRSSCCRGAVNKVLNEVFLRHTTDTSSNEALEWLTLEDQRTPFRLQHSVQAVCLPSYCGPITWPITRPYQEYGADHHHDPQASSDRLSTLLQHVQPVCLHFPFLSLGQAVLTSSPHFIDQAPRHSVLKVSKEDLAEQEQH